MPKTRKQRPLTQDELEELKRCSREFSYFASYLKLNKDDQPIQWRDYQYKAFEVLQSYSRVIAKWCKHSGRRLVEAAYMLWFLTFRSAQFVVYSDTKVSLGKKTLALMKRMYMNLPKWLQKKADFKKLYVQFGEGYDRNYMVLNGYAADTCRGRTITMLVCHDFHKVKQRIADDYLASLLPVMCSGVPDRHHIIIDGMGCDDKHDFALLWENSVKLPSLCKPDEHNFAGMNVTYEKDVIKYTHTNYRTTEAELTYRLDYECEFVETMPKMKKVFLPCDGLLDIN